MKNIQLGKFSMLKHKRFIIKVLKKVLRGYVDYERFNSIRNTISQLFK